MQHYTEPTFRYEVPEDESILVAPTHFTVIRLHDRCERCWAVISNPSGSIAMDQDGELIMRLTRNEAKDLARTMTAVLRDVGGDRGVRAAYSHRARDQ